MKIKSISITVICLLIAFIVAACEIKVVPPSNWAFKKESEGVKVPLKAQVSLNKIAVGVVKDGWETIEVTAVDKAGESDGWEVQTSDEAIATVSIAGDQITVRGLAPGEAVLSIVSNSAIVRKVPVRVYSLEELNLGDLTISYVTEFEFRWTDIKSGGVNDGSFWHPIMPDPSWHALGSLGFKGYDDPNGKHWMIIVKEVEGSEALKQPLDYVKEYDDRGSGARHNGSFWTPVCPSGYVPMGTVVNMGWQKPNINDVTCVRKDLTKEGEVGDFVWSDRETGATYYLGSWQITIPDIPIHESAYLETGTFVAWGNADAARKRCMDDDCWDKPKYHPVINVLSVNLPMLIDTPMETKYPRLKGFEQPSSSVEPLMLKSMLVPFSALLGGNQIKKTDAEWLVRNSPFVRVDRIIHNKLMFHTRNNSSLIQENHLELVSGISKTNSETVSHTVGVSISHEVGVDFKGVSAKTTVTASYGFGYETMHSVTELKEKHIKVAINVLAGKAAACWQQRNIYRVMWHNKGELDILADLEFGIDTYFVDEYPD